MPSHPDCQPEAMALLVVAFISSEGQRTICAVSPPAQMVEPVLGKCVVVGQHCDSRRHSLVCQRIATKSSGRNPRAQAHTSRNRASDIAQSHRGPPNEPVTFIAS